mmetsp:Transcript_59331/g.126129  ORF Transcript_59331/g.126129 Transcript_59331/m.126129 type:complete len:269 (+) Transcript_59331:280-1086(+)
MEVPTVDNYLLRRNLVVDEGVRRRRNATTRTTTTKWAVGRGAQAGGAAVRGKVRRAGGRVRREGDGVLVGHSQRRELQESVHGRDGEVFDVRAVSRSRDGTSFAAVVVLALYLMLSSSCWGILLATGMPKSSNFQRSWRMEQHSNGETALVMSHAMGRTLGAAARTAILPPREERSQAEERLRLRRLLPPGLDRRRARGVQRHLLGGVPPPAGKDGQVDQRQHRQAGDMERKGAAQPEQREELLQEGPDESRMEFDGLHSGVSVTEGT